MDIEYKGANCLLITSKKTTIVIDPKLSSVGLKDVLPKNAVVIATQSDLLAEGNDAVTVNGPGEYEVRNISIVGAAAERMIDHDKSLQSTIYRVVVGDVTFAVVGHAAAPLTEEQLEVIPTHYADKAVKYEVPQMELEPFVKELSAVAHETMPKWKVKGALPEVLTLVELERTA